MRMPMDSLDVLLQQRAVLSAWLREDSAHGPRGQTLKAEIADLGDRITAQSALVGLGRSGLEEPTLKREPVMGGVS